MVMVAVVVIAVLGVAGHGVAGVFCSVTTAISKSTPTACQTAPQEGDVCITYTFEPHPWYYVWQYHNNAWARIAEPGGVRPTCSFSENPDNGSRHV
nr:hypothetical protein [uncultured bacterium]